MRKYEPGPWHVDESGDICTKDGFSICSVLGRNNARLIATAPESIEANRNARMTVQAFLDMVNVIKRHQALPIPAILDIAQHNCPIILTELDAVIAKAEGH